MYKVLNVNFSNFNITLERKENLIKSIIGFITIKDIQTPNSEGKTILYKLCNDRMSKSIRLLNRKLKLKPKHFLNADKYGDIELILMCYYGMSDIIDLIGGWKIEHFLLQNKNGRSGLHYLCEQKMETTIKMLTKKYNIQWEPKHCIGWVEHTYMQSINAFTAQPVAESVVIKSKEFM